MASKPISVPVSHITQTPLGSPYCSDPNCESCKQLREAQEKVKAGSSPTTAKIGLGSQSR